MRNAVVTVVAGRHDHLRAQRGSLARSAVPVDLHVVVALGDSGVRAVVAESAEVPSVVVDLPADPLGLPLAAGRNAGAQAALDAGSDLLVFLDVDCLAAGDLLGRYADAAGQQPDGLLCGPVTYLPPAPDGGWTPRLLERHRNPHAARPDPADGALERGRHELFWSLGFAVTAGTWQRIGGFDEGYVGYGAEDTDFARQAESAGVGLYWVGGADAFHQHHPTATPPVQHLAAILRNGGRFAERWGSWPMAGWFERFERDGLVRAERGGWVRSAPVRVATIPAQHPYVSAVLSDGVTAVRPDRTVGWEPDPLFVPGALGAAADELDAVHLHFGFERLARADLQRWLGELRELGLPLVVTVHDLRTPHHADGAGYDRLLADVVAAADDVLTLTAGAAREIGTRFGREAVVLAHPTLLGSVPPVRPAAEPRTVLIALKSLRANVCRPDWLVAAAAAGADDAGGRVRVSVHPAAAERPELAGVRALAAAGRLDLAVHERWSDDEVVAEVAGAHAIVLPYRFGTHSGWLELARDVGTRVVVPSCGHLAEQAGCVDGPGCAELYTNDERAGLRADTLRSAVARAVRGERPAPADRAARLTERAQVRMAHELRYRALVRR